MSSIVVSNYIFRLFRALRISPNFKMLSLPKLTNKGLTLLGMSFGIALVMILTKKFRRNRGSLRKLKAKDRPRDLPRVSSPMASHSFPKETSSGMSSCRSYSPRSIRHIRSASNSSLVSSQSQETMTGTFLFASNSEEFPPVQLCDQGLECMQKAITYWELAIEKLEESDMGDEEALLTTKLNQLLEHTYRICDHYEGRIHRHIVNSVAVDSAVDVLSRLENHPYHSCHNSVDDDTSDIDSFVSAEEVINLSDLDDQCVSYQNTELFMYMQALDKLARNDLIPCRSLKTNLLCCSSDIEFLCKLHCIRQGFSDLLSHRTVRDWFALNTRLILKMLLEKADRDSEEFEEAFDAMLQYVEETGNWQEIEEELSDRGVKVMNFYDIVLDFIMMDAFEDLENPPASVLCVIQNRWLSNSFKESALSTAIWSVLKAKRRMLKVKKGFVAHFYAISEHISPVFAWAFLGPVSELQSTCITFKNIVLSFIRDMFNFSCIRFTCVEEISSDLHDLSVKYLNLIMKQLCNKVC